MGERATLDATLSAWARGDELRGEIAATVLSLASACHEIAALLALGALAGPLAVVTGRHGEMDPQRELDVLANNKIIAALAIAPVALLVSEELDDPLPMRTGARLIVAVDPLDGATNADTNAAIGTIFSILPNRTDPAHLCTGTSQLAAGFVVYGPQTVLVLTVGAGTSAFTFNPAARQFELTAPNLAIPKEAAEFAINASNHWHWDEPIRTYVDDCLRGKDGPRAADYNMRWTGSFVAEIYRILVRGGVYLYPGDRRKGYRDGRLRLVYEANPVAWLVEQAGGGASTGCDRILEISAHNWHQRTPVIIGSRSEVTYVERLQRDPHAITGRSPLFGRRGLFRI
jgi:fructose-1,6-bisphosphatase I